MKGWNARQESDLSRQSSCHRSMSQHFNSSRWLVIPALRQRANITPAIFQNTCHDHNTNTHTATHTRGSLPSCFTAAHLFSSSIRSASSISSSSTSSSSSSSSCEGREGGADSPAREEGQHTYSVPWNLSMPQGSSMP